MQKMILSRKKYGKMDKLYIEKVSSVCILITYKNKISVVDFDTLIKSITDWISFKQ